PRDLDRFLEAVLLDQLLELGAAGDIGALADVDKQQLRRDYQRLQPGQPRVSRGAHRDTSLFFFHGSASSSDRGSRRGGSPRTASAMARIWSGVVPQQPPTRFNSPERANSSRVAAVSSGVSSYSAKAFGSPALGWALTKQSATRARVSTCGRRSLAPSAQFRPTASGRECETEMWKASAVWPERVRPEASVMVPETITGRRAPRASKASSIANSAALALRVSKMVSTINTSAPPSIRPSIATR